MSEQTDGTSTSNTFDKDFWKRVQKEFDSCPHCGYCKHCGRGGQFTPYQPVPYYPAWPQWPQFTWTTTDNITSYS